MAWNFQLVGAASAIAPALVAKVVTTQNPDEVSQVAAVKGYLATKLAGIPQATQLLLHAEGSSTASGINISIGAQVITIS